MVMQILGEISNKGQSNTLDNLLYADFKEKPVDIETFITDDHYLGKAWKDAAVQSVSCCNDGDFPWNYVGGE